MIVEFDKIIGKTFTKVKCRGDEIIFSNATDKYSLKHDQDCCEHVVIDDIIGDLKSLVNATIVNAYKSTNSKCGAKAKYDESYTWTFINISTIKGSVTIKFYGTSNGYYSEDADLYQLPITN